MFKQLTRVWAACGLFAAVSLPLASSVDAKDTYYWISHGSPTDPVWTYFLQGAEQWAKDTGNDVKTSFHSGDVPSHQEAVRAAIAAKARARVERDFSRDREADEIVAVYRRLWGETATEGGLPSPAAST